MFTQDTAHLSNDAQLFYTDSGPVPNSSDYTTVIFIHGTGFNGHVFENLHSVAASRNLRTISVNRRDYPGSTPFTDQELDDVKNGRQCCVDEYALLMVEFICFVADNFQIPTASADHSSGGIALVGWSHGGAVALWTLSNPEVVSCPQRATLEKFLKTVIMYDSAAQSLGFPVPEAEPVGDEPKSAEEYFHKLPFWLTSYFDHPVDWNGDITLLDRRCTSDKATWNILSEEEKTRFITWEVMSRFELPMYEEPMLSTQQRATQRALWDEDLVRTFCPLVTFGCISTGRSLWLCRLGSHLLQEKYKELTSKGVQLRPLKTIHIAEGSHLAHYDYTSEFLDAIESLAKAKAP